MGELHWTSDPRELVPGDAGAILDTADGLMRYGTTLISVGEAFKKIDSETWRSDAAEAYRAFSQQQPKRWINSGESFCTAAVSLRRYAETLTWAQGQAREAVARYENARRILESSSGFDQIAYALRINDGPAAEEENAARDTLDRARTQLSEVGDWAAGKIREATEDAPSKSIFDTVVDALKGMIQGAIDEARSAVDGVTHLLSANQSTMIATFAGTADALVSNTGDFIKEQINADTWRDDPARAVGALLPGLLGKRVPKKFPGKSLDEIHGLGLSERKGLDGGSGTQILQGENLEITPNIREAASYMSPWRANHIVYGDEKGGYHIFHDNPREGDTVFNKEWSADKIVEATQSVASSDKSTWTRETGPTDSLLIKSGQGPARFWVDGTFDGVNIRVMVEPYGEGIITAYPPR